MASRSVRVCTVHAPIGKSIGIEIDRAVRAALTEQGITQVYFSPPSESGDLVIMARVPEDMKIQRRGRRRVVP